MEYDVNRNEFVKTQKTKYVIQMSKHIFQIYMDGIVHDGKFLQVILLLCSNMFCEIFYLLCCFMFAGLKCNVHSSHWCVYFQILYSTMDFYKWKLNLTWSCKWIICKMITEQTCWSVGVWLTSHMKFYTCNNSRPK